MKKLILFLTLAAFAVSCEKTLLEPESNLVEATSLSKVAAESEVAGYVTRTVTTGADFDPLHEIMQNKIAINLVNVGNTQNSYLRCYGAGEEVRLTDNDCGESTRWYINPFIYS